MATPFIEIETSDAPMQLVDLAGERVIVGSAISCDVVIERPEFAREHLLLSPRPDGCYVALAKDAPTPVLYDGRALDKGIVPWGSELLVGGVRFTLHDGSVTREAYKRRPKKGSAAAKEGINPIVIAFTLVLIPFAAWMLLSPAEEDIPTAMPAPPELFDPLARTCPQADPVQARVLAAEAARQATAKAERMPFRSQDGVEAVAQYALAAACSRATGDTVTADAQTAAAQAIESRMQTEVTNHRFRLDRALQLQRSEVALTETRLLERLYDHRATTPYYRWLVSAERRLQLRIDQKAAATAQ